MVRIALAQVDCALGEVEANLGHAGDRVAEARAQGAELVVFPELSLHGYHLGEIAGDRSLPAADPRLARLAEAGPDVLIGFHEDGGTRTYNAAAHLGAGRTRHLHRKLYLPNYLVWEERKRCSPGQAMRAYDTGFGRVATLICNDAWQPVLPWLAGAVALLAVARRRAGPAQARARHWSLWAFRLAALAPLAAIVANPVHVNVTPAPLHRPDVHVLLDASQSMKLGSPESRCW